MPVTFAVAVRKGLHRVVDVAWELGFAAVSESTAAVGHGDAARRILVTTLSVVRGLCLAAHIAGRGHGHGHGEHPRHEAVLVKAPGSRNLYALRMIGLFQGALVWLVSLPVQAAAYGPGPLMVLTGPRPSRGPRGCAPRPSGNAQLAAFKAHLADAGPHHGLQPAELVL
ncbi:hypothetical protein DN051_39080 [Streptomyces cadmiisoli]|uniref:Uncharacterized protein n=2 Tax=Streptomyces cadmiisoli TaxID=2184053 RepID=A0A2Z4JDA3_9ACTN|nr:hypothetical protein DN051_39080 [Streptomyces cadmiisoli]